MTAQEALKQIAAVVLDGERCPDTDDGCKCDTWPLHEVSIDEAFEKLAEAVGLARAALAAPTDGTT